MRLLRATKCNNRSRRTKRFGAKCSENNWKNNEEKSYYSEQKRLEKKLIQLENEWKGMLANEM